MRASQARSSAFRLLSLTAPAQRSQHTVCSRCYTTISNYNRPVSSSYLSHSQYSPRRRRQSTFAAAVQAAQTYFNEGKPDIPLPGGVQVDPFKTVAKEMKFLTNNIRSLLGSGHPVLETVSKYYTQSEGKYIRPMLVLLMSQATAKIPGDRTADFLHPVDTPISPPAILADENPSHPAASPTSFADHSLPATTTDDILPSQRRLAEISELIHTASLLHDDVIDFSTSRRNAPSANIQFGNKMAVLAGDFLLGRASVALARLRNPEVTELLATVIANLIEGEFMQLRNTAHDEARPAYHPTETMDYYLRKTYLKSASLISKSCRAAALLGGQQRAAVEAAYAYGKNLGLAFQLVDDMLDFTRSAQELGKPAGADLELGLATAPLIFAWRDNPELGELVGRKFEHDGDVARVSLSFPPHSSDDS